MRKFHRRLQIVVSILFAFVFLTTPINAAPYFDQLAPKSQIGDARMQARANLVKYLKEYAQLRSDVKKNMTKKARGIVESTMKELEAKILDSARIYMVDSSLEYIVAEGGVMRGGHVGLRGKRGIYVLSKRQEERSDLGISGVLLANRLRTLDDNVGDYHVRVYSKSRSWTRRSVIAAGAATFGLGGLANYLLKNTESGNRDSDDPLDADVVMVLGGHFSVEAMKPQLEVLGRVFEMHRKKRADVKDIQFIDEIGVPYVVLLPSLYSQYPQLRNVPLGDLLLKPDYRIYWERLYKNLCRDLQKDYKELFQNGVRTGMLRHSDPMFEALWNFLLANKINAMPEPPEFEGWMDGNLGLFYDRRTEESLRSKDVDGFFRFSSMAQERYHSAAKRRDTTLALHIAAIRKQAPGTRVLLIRGTNHIGYKSIFEGRDFSFGVINTDANTYQGEPTPMIDIPAKIAKNGPTTDPLVREYDNVVLFVHDVLLTALMARGSSLNQANRDANLILKELGTPTDIVRWFKDTLRQADSPDSNGRFLIQALKMKNFADPSRGNTLGGGIITIAPSMISKEGLTQAHPGLSTSTQEKDFESGPARVVRVEVDPAVFDVHVAVKKDLQGYLQPVDRPTGVPVCVSPEGDLITDVKKINELLWTDASVVQEFSSSHPGASVFAFADNCSLFFNEGFITFANGELFCPNWEPYTERAYPSLVVKTSGEIVMGEIRYQRTTMGAIRGFMGEQDITQDVRYATSGQFLLDGNGNPRADMKEAVPQFQDMRHVFRLPKIALKNLPDRKNAELNFRGEPGTDKIIGPPEVFFGMFDLLKESRRLAKDAWDGPILLPMRVVVAVETILPGFEKRPVAVPPDILIAALKESGYKPVEKDAQMRPGDFYLEEKQLRIFLKPAVYPRTLVGVDKNGKLLIVGVEGKSGRSGSTLEESARLAQEFGLQQAMLLDHGGNAKIHANGHWLLESSEARPVKTSALLITSKSPDLTVRKPPTAETPGSMELWQAIEAIARLECKWITDPRQVDVLRVQDNILSIHRATQSGRHETMYYPACGKDILRPLLAYDLSHLLAIDFYDPGLEAQLSDLGIAYTVYPKDSAKIFDFVLAGKARRVTLVLGDARAFDLNTAMQEEFASYRAEPDFGYAQSPLWPGIHSELVDIFHVYYPTGMDERGIWDYDNYHSVHSGGFLCLSESMLVRNDSLPKALLEILGVKEIPVTMRHPYTITTSYYPHPDAIVQEPKMGCLYQKVSSVSKEVFVAVSAAFERLRAMQQTFHQLGIGKTKVATRKVTAVKREIANIISDLLRAGVDQGKVSALAQELLHTANAKFRAAQVRPFTQNDLLDIEASTGISMGFSA